MTNTMKYLADGRAVEVIQKLESGYLVEYWYSHGDEPYLDSLNLQVVDVVFDEPPTVQFHQDITTLKAEIEKLEELRDSKLDELKSASREIAKASEKRKQHEQLRLLDDFIAGKITHYVELYAWGGPKIVEFDDAKSEYRNDGLKLLTLFGNSQGNLQWKLNQYKDGSGRNVTVMPTTSYEDAVTIAKAHIVDRLEETKENPEKRIVEYADKWNVPVPDEYRDEVMANQRTAIIENIEKRRQELWEIEKQLKALDA